MVIFYDFDGTLTPYPIPQYEIIRTCGKDNDTFQQDVLMLANQMNINIYDAYFETFKKLLMDRGFAYSAKVIALGADKVEFNPGVIEFLAKMKSLGVKQYIVTSGYAEYVRKTLVSKYVDGIFGTEFKDENEDGILDKILTDADKVEVIKNVLAYMDGETVLYLGDGLTDKDAFSYVHSIGGKALFIGDKEDVFEVLNNYNIIDETFPRDYTDDSKISEYVSTLLKKR